MALNGANANLGPESDAWVRELETLVLNQARELERALSLLKAVTG